MIPPTKAQARVLAAIRDMTRDGVPPSYQELGEVLAKSRSQIHYALARMKDRGLVDFEYGRSRSIRIIEPVEIDLSEMTGADLVRLRGRVEAELIQRWVL